MIMGLFSFAESPQLQALLADIAPPATRDASYALYFTLAFGVGSLWTAVYGVVIEALGEPVGVPVVFGLMAVAFIAAAAGHAADPDRAGQPVTDRRRTAPADEASGHTPAAWTPGSCSSRMTRRSAR